MPRKKKTDIPVYVRAGLRDTLTLISLRTSIDISVLRDLNPKIRSTVYPIPYGERVRIK